MSQEVSFIAAERQRVRKEYQRRERDVRADLYALWQPEVILTRSSRLRIATTMLHRAGVFPKADDHCLEVGFGSIGWLGDLVTFGVNETNLHGIELDPARATRTKKILPGADLRVGDATALPWQDNSFRLVIASTVFTSILDSVVRQIIAAEIVRVLAPRGALLWYDFAVNNPGNQQVRRVGRRELRQLFPRLQGEITSATLAPPLARIVTPRSWVLATFLEAIPFLRTHLVAVLVKTS